MKRFILVLGLVLGLLLAVGICSPAQENTIAPPESLVAESVPGIPASLSETIGRYTENRDGFSNRLGPRSGAKW